MLNAYPYASGHLLVMPSAMSAPLAELTERVRRAVVGDAAGAWPRSRRPTSPTGSTWAPTSAGPPARASRRTCTCTSLPRWSGDTNFMTAVAGAGHARVAAGGLEEAHRRLARLAAAGGAGPGSGATSLLGQAARTPALLRRLAGRVRGLADLLRSSSASTTQPRAPEPILQSARPPSGGSPGLACASASSSGFALVGVAAWVLSSKGSELAGFGDVFETVNWWWVPPAFAAEIGSYVCFAAMQYELLQAGKLRAPFGPLVKVSFGAQALTNSLPAGNAVASVYGFRWFRRFGADNTLAAWALAGTLVAAVVSLALVALDRVGYRNRRGRLAGPGSRHHRGLRLHPRARLALRLRAATSLRGDRRP